MITLPPGFDVNVLFNDYFQTATYFIPVAFIFVYFKYAKKALKVG